VATAIGLNLAGWTMARGPLVFRAALSLLFLLGIAFYRWRRERRIVGLLGIVFWSLTFGILYLTPMYLAARCPVPFRDDVLARMDRVLGVEMPALLPLIDAVPGVKGFLDWCYNTLVVFVVVAIMLPPVCGKMGRAKEYLIAGIASAILSIPLFAVLPAKGPWCYYGYPATPDQDKVTSIIVDLKNADHFVMNVSDTEGIISFPSFHTVLALLAAFALWSVPYVRWPAALLAFLIVLSTVTTGWHYLCDVVAGFVITALSCLVAKGYTRLEARWNRTAQGV
jgi:membrane-associated phospholipid phosphatase